MRKHLFLRHLTASLCGLLLMGTAFAHVAYSTITPVNAAGLAHYKANIIKRGDALQEFNFGFYANPSFTPSTKVSLTHTMAEEQRQAILHELQKQNALLATIAHELAGKGK